MTTATLDTTRAPAAPQPCTRPAPRRRDLTLITLLALALRLMLVWQINRVLTDTQIMQIQWDAPEYIHLARNLAHKGTYIDWNASSPAERAKSHHLGLLRTPAYPFFYAIFEWLGAAPKGVLWAQAVLGTLIAPCAMLLAHHMLRSRLAGWLAGVLVALSPTGIGLCGIPLVDSPLGVITALGFTLFYFGLATPRRWLLVVAGLAFTVAVLLKPSLIYWPALAPLAAWLVARSEARRVPWRFVGIMIAIQLTGVCLWCYRNLRTEGVWMFSSITGQNAYTFVTLQIKLWSERGHPVSGEELLQTQYAFRDAELAEVFSGRRTPGQAARRQEQLSVQWMRRHPWIAARVLYGNAACTVPNAWCHMGQQLPGPELDAALRSGAISPADVPPEALTPTALAIARFYRALNVCQWRYGGRCVVYTMMALALLLPLIRAGYRGQSPGQALAARLALALVAFYFLALCSTSFAAGYRLIYPAEFFAVILAVAGASHLRWLATRGAR